MSLGAGSPGTVYVDIYAVDGSDLPTGSSLGTATVAASSLNIWPSWSSAVFTFSPYVTLSSGTQYCFVVSTSSGSWSSHYINIGTNGSDTYANGDMGKYNDVVWATFSNTYPATIRSPDAPSKATNPTPANSATGVSLTLSELSWTGDAGADTHDVYFGPTGSMVLVSEDQVAETWSVTGLPLTQDQEYSWRIDSTNDVGTTTGDVWTFTTGGAPSKAITPAPTNAATGILLGLGLMTWEDGGDADSFDVWFGPSGNMAKVSSAQAGLSYSIGYPLNYNTTYQWRIDAINAFGTTTGDTWSFSCITFSPPLPTGVTLSGSSGPNGEGTPTGTPTGFNNMITIKKLIAVAENRFWVEDI
jgi:hypothetical protein